MSRKTLDLVLSGGGILFAILLVALGYILAEQASFAADYEKDQLGDQKIVFPTADKLTEDERTWKPGSSCLERYAGQTMETGRQAECYANFYIKLHMTEAAENAGFPGETYATLGGIQTQLRSDLAAANQRGDSNEAATIQKKLDAVGPLRTTMQTGETLRGLLLTSYGFSIFGDKAGLAADVCYLAGALVGLLALAGLVHAARTPPDRPVFASSRQAE